MYPIVVLIAVAVLKKDRGVDKYVLPLSIIGFLFAVYHNLLYVGIIPESLAPCVTGVSCTTKYVEYFGFITIPFLSAVSFVVIIASMIIYRKIEDRKFVK